MIPKSRRAITSPTKWWCAQILYSKNGPLRNSKGRTENNRRFWQKCHTGLFSHSRLLREARMLHYVPTSRSARIVVKTLHESPGPTTAGASLFCVSFSPSPIPERPRPTVLILYCGSALTSQKRRKILPLLRRQNACACEPENRLAVPPAQKGACASPPGRAPPRVRIAASEAEIKSQRRRQTLLEMTLARCGSGDRNFSLMDNRDIRPWTKRKRSVKWTASALP